MVTVAVGPEDVELVADLLWTAGVAGVEEVTVDGRCELRAGCVVTSLDEVLAALGARWSVRVAEVSAAAGLDDWREHAESWRAGSHLVVVPPWLDPPADVRDDDLVLSIDPGHAFGSGSHTTTRDCLAMLERLVAPGSTVVDLGCGSGVLSIAAVLLGAERAVATDIDAAAVDATVSNATRLGVIDRIEVSTVGPDALADGSASIVVANIGAAVLRGMATELVRVLAPTGVMVLSGILAEQLDDVVAAYSSLGARADEVVESGEWRTIRMTVPGGR